MLKENPHKNEEVYKNKGMYQKENVLVSSDGDVYIGTNIPSNCSKVEVIIYPVSEVYLKDNTCCVAVPDINTVFLVPLIDYDYLLKTLQDGGLGVFCYKFNKVWNYYAFI